MNILVIVAEDELREMTFEEYEPVLRKLLCDGDPRSICADAVCYPPHREEMTRQCFSKEKTVAEANRLRMGADSPSPTLHEEEERVAVLRATVEKYVPDFARAVAEIAARGNDEDVMGLHQDAFARGYHDDEYTLLGMAIKYAGLHGVTLSVIGRNRET